MKLPHNEVKFYPKVKSQTGLSSLWVSCKCAINVGTNERVYKEKSLNKTLSMFTISERNFRRAFEKS